MNSMISWEQLIIFIAVFLFLYYAIILFLFYRQDLPLLVKASKKEGADRSPHLSHKSTPSPETAAPDTTLYNIVYEMMEDCKPVFHACVEQSLEKEQVLEALQIRIKKYPQIKGTAFQIAVANHIEQELESRCGIRLIDHDLESLWQ